MRKIKKEKFILYNQQDFSNDENTSKNLTEKERKELYNKIDKRQKRNAKIISISIFLYVFSIAYLISSLEYFEKLEQEGIWLLSTFGIVIIATFLLIYALVTKSKDGKIKYQYKNTKYFIFACVFGAIGIFTLFGGFISLISLNMSFFIGFVLLGLSISFDIYHDLIKGKEKGHLSLFAEIIIVTILVVVSGGLGYYLNYEKVNNLDFTEDYSKSAVVLYDKNDKIHAIAKSKNVWYTFIEEKNSNINEFSVSSAPENLEYVYETKDTEVYNLSANDNYAVWTEVGEKEIGYFYYDRDENQVYELIKMAYNVSETPQNYNTGLYDNKIYYEIIDYEKKEVYIMEYDIATNETNLVYTVGEYNTNKLAYQSLNVNDNNLLLTTYINNTPSLIHVDLNQVHKENYKPNVITFNKNYYDIYSVSYSNESDNYAIYYNDQNIRKIGIFNEDGILKQDVTTFNKNHYAYEDKIYLKNNTLYWNDTYDSKKLSVNDFSLKIYDIKAKKTQTIPKIYNYTIDNNTIYGLGFYRDSLKDIRLYEIWN